MTTGLFRDAKRLWRPFRRFLNGPPAAIRLIEGIRHGRFSRDVGVTVGGRKDGGGAQVQGVMSGLCLASAARIRYLHSPFVSIESSFTDPARAALRWESFFNLGYGEAKVDVRAHNLVDLTQFLADRSLWLAPDVVVRAKHYHEFCDRWPESYNQIVDSLRRKYARSDKSSLPLHGIADGVVVSAHVRRIHSAVHEAPRRLTGDEPILKAIFRATEILNAESLPFKVNVFSDAAATSLGRFLDAGYEVHAGEDDLATFHNLAQADVLIMAKSSFSYCAAMLSEGVKLYEPFWHAPLTGWLRLAPDGAFEAEDFRNALRDRLRQKGKAMSQLPR